MNLGNIILKIRKDNKMSQEDFAEILNVTRQTVSNWENEKNYPDIETLIKISNEFNISLDILLKDDKKMIKDLTKNFKYGKMFKVIIPLMIFFIVLLLIIHLIANHSYIAEYNEILDVNLMGNENGWNLNVNLSSGGIIKGINIPYEQNGEKVNIIFTNIKETIRDRVKSTGYITTIDMDYNNIDYNEKIKVYYTMTNLDNIKNKSKEEIKQIINDSTLIFDNNLAKSTIICNLKNKEYEYTLTYYDFNKQIISSVGDELLPEDLHLNTWNSDGKSKMIWFPTDKSTKVFNKIEDYFIKNGGKCLIK